MPILFTEIAVIPLIFLAFYAIFINGRVMRKILKEYGKMLSAHGKTLECNVHTPF